MRLSPYVVINSVTPDGPTNDLGDDNTGQGASMTDKIPSVPM